MTTTKDRLLELAAAYQQKADALRLAAAELNGHETGKARATIDAKLQAAATLRQVHSNGTAVVNRSELKKRRVAALRALVATGGPHRSRDLRDALEAQGFGRIDHSTITNDLNGLGATRHGVKAAATWSLSDETSQPDRPAAKKAKRTKAKKKGTTAEHIQRARQTSAKLLARIGRSDTPVTTNLGRTIGALLRRGYVKKTAEGYVRTDKEFVV